jgi:hypothetical protein
MTYRKNSISKPPFGGFNDNAPAAGQQPSSFRNALNWMIRYNRITPFYRTFEWPEQSMLNGQVLMGFRTYTDIQGFVHSVYVTNLGWGEIVPGNPYSITNNLWPADYPPFDDSQLFSMCVFNGQLFFDNGVIPLSYHKGDGKLYSVTAGVSNSTGDFQGAAFFLYAYADRLLAINTVEPYPILSGSTNFPRRVRYSAVNNANEWDFTIDASAGLFDITDAEDALTGWVTVNQTGFAFRKNGITSVSVTGQAQIPFFVENFSVGPDGVGCFIPYTLSPYGTVAGFVSQDDVYIFTGGAPQPIGGPARRSIYRDLARQSSAPFARTVGSFGNFVDYLSYWLVIPVENDERTSMWIFHWEDKSWMNFVWPYGAERCVVNVATS